MRAFDSEGEVTTGADVAGMIGSAGVAHPGGSSGGDVAPLGGGVWAVGASGAAVGAAVPAPPRSSSAGSASPWLRPPAYCPGDAHGPDPAVPMGPRPASDERTILHVDIVAFLAEIEHVRDPRLAGRPVIVGAGVIASCSYEARRFGLKAGMSLSEARRLCPEAVILEGHAQVYRCFAERIFDLCREVAPAIECHLDEAYCDLTGTGRLHGDPRVAGQHLKQRIRAATGLGVTCGIGPNRMLAKLIGKTVKPDGLARITAAEADAFLRDRPIEQLAGVGHAHARTLRSMNLRTIGELRALSAEVLVALFGANGRLLYERCCGRDTAAVDEREIPRSISRETSFHRDTADPAEIDGMLEYLVGRACRTARELGSKPRTVAVRLRYSDGEGCERARGLGQPSDAGPVVLALALGPLRRQFTRRVALHHLGVTLSSFVRCEGEEG